MQTNKKWNKQMKQNIHKANKTSRLNKYKQEKKQANKNQMKQANTWKQTNETNKVKNTYKQANKKATKQHKEKQKQRHTYKKRGKPKCLPVQSFSINRKGFWLKDWPADVYDCRQFKGHAHAGFINQNTLKRSKKAYEDCLIQSAKLNRTES